MSQDEHPQDGHRHWDEEQDKLMLAATQAGFTPAYLGGQTEFLMRTLVSLSLYSHLCRACWARKSMLTFFCTTRHVPYPGGKMASPTSDPALP